MIINYRYWAVLLLFFTTNAFGEVYDSPKSVEISPGVIIFESTAYTMAETGHIEATDIKTDDRLWQSRIRGKPLASGQHKLIVQVMEADEPSVLSLSVIDTGTGIESGQIKIRLPDHVIAVVDHQLDYSFDSTAVFSNDELLIDWQATFRPVTDIPGPTLKTLQGQIKIDIESQSAQVIENIVNDEHDPPAAILQWIEEHGYPAVLLEENKVWVASYQLKSHLLMKLWDLEGQPVKEIVLNDNISHWNASYVSVDRRHLLVSQVDKTPGDDWNIYKWSIYAMPVGRLAGETHSFQSVSKFIVIDKDILFITEPYGRRIDDQWVEVPYLLNSVDLENGKTRWQVQIRNINFHGLVPPVF